ncbi:MAG: methyltransferase domain-containing protein [Novosphingobium sp.]
MHDTAYRIGGLVIDTYLPSTPARILEIGAQNVNGTLRHHAPRNAEYIGLDFEAGDGVDMVVTGLADWNVPDGHFDLVMASSVFEHDKAFWQTFLAMCAKAKPGGHIYVSAPSNGTIHRYPQDYWRFYPDAGLALEEWARDAGFEVTLVESFVAERESEVYNDFSAVFRRGPSDAPLNRDFVHGKVRSANALTWRSSAIVNPMADSEDTRLLKAAHDKTQEWIAHSNHLNALHAEELERRTMHISDLTQEIEQQTRRLTALDQGAAGKDEELSLLRARVGKMAVERDRLDAETQQHAEQIRQSTEAFSVLQSRLAQRDEEAAQAWASADEHKRERDRLAEEAEKARRNLAEANGWVERLAFTRTQLERRVARLENELASLAREFQRVEKRQSATLVEGSDVRSAQNDAPPPLAEQAQSNAPVGLVDPVEPSVRPQNRLEADHERAQANLEECRAKLTDVASEASESRFRLDECRNEVASLSDMVAASQDRVAELEAQNEWLRQAGRFLLEHGNWWWRFMPSAWQRRQRDRILLARNLFDSEAYSDRYPDVLSSGQDPFRHFIYHGIAENRRYN